MLGPTKASGAWQLHALPSPLTLKPLQPLPGQCPGCLQVMPALVHGMEHGDCPAKQIFSVWKRGEAQHSGVEGSLVAGLPTGKS